MLKKLQRNSKVFIKSSKNHTILKCHLSRIKQSIYNSLITLFILCKLYFMIYSIIFV